MVAGPDRVGPSRNGPDPLGDRTIPSFPELNPIHNRRRRELLKGRPLSPFVCPSLEGQ